MNQLAWYAEQDIRLALKRARSWVRKLKKAADDFMSESIVYADLVHPDDLEQGKEELAKRCEEGATDFSKEYSILTGLGDVQWVEEKTFIQREEGVITHYQSIIVDITERKQGMN